MEHTDTAIIVATIVPEAERLDFLPRHFGPLMLTVERQICSWLSTLSPDYSGSYFNFYDLSNGGAYIAPTTPVRFRFAVRTNDFSGTLSADAAGITVTLFALSSLAFQFPRIEILSTRFHQLRHFAAEHAERRLIFQAID
jgi:antirestriction protein